MALSLLTNFQNCLSVVVSLLLYGAGTKAPLDKHCTSVSICLLSRLRQICGKSSRVYFTKFQTFQSTVVSVLLYGAKSVTQLSKHCAAMSLCELSKSYLWRFFERLCVTFAATRLTFAAIFSMCWTWGMESQFRCKRLRWYRHFCRMLDAELPKVMLSLQVKGSKPQGWLRKVDMVLSCQTFTSCSHSYHDTQSKPTWQEAWVTHLTPVLEITSLLVITVLTCFLLLLFIVTVVLSSMRLELWFLPT